MATANRTCSIDGCSNKHEARGYCGKHYLRFLRYGSPLGSAPKVQAVCSVCGGTFEYTPKGGHPPKTCPGECRKLGRRAYYEEHRDMFLKHAEKQRENKREYLREYMAEWRDRNRELMRDSDAERREVLANRSDAAIQAEMESRHPDGVKRCRFGHTAGLSEFFSVRSNVDGLSYSCKTCSRRDRRELLANTGQTMDVCFYCKTGDSEGMQVDHVVALALGGEDTFKNYVPACPDCNRRKNSRPVAAWYRERFGIEFDAGQLPFGEYLTGRYPEVFL